MEEFPLAIDKSFPATRVRAVTALLSFAFPTALSTAAGLAAVEGLGGWIPPTAAFVLVSAFIQILLRIITNFYSERRDVMAAFKAASSEMSEQYRQLLTQERETRAQERESYNMLLDSERANSQTYRHALANHINAINLENALLRSGHDPASVPRAQTVYPEFAGADTSSAAVPVAIPPDPSK